MRRINWNTVGRLALMLVLAALVMSCSRVLITGRKQLLLVSDSEMLSMGLQAYQQYIDSVPLSGDIVHTEMVQRTGRMISASVEDFMRANGFESELKHFAWEFSLVQDSTVNAFCMPGGKVVFFEGILPFTKTEGGMAVVMGHEIAHAVAKHSNERMSQYMLMQVGAVATDVLLSSKSETTRMGMNVLYGLGAQVGVLLPYSRKHEYEADRLGMIFMAMAGYDPRDAVAFWERMSAGKSGSALDFMSTHPSDDKRIANMHKVLPEAMGYYERSKGTE